jgi:hypothetical protein
VPMPRDADLRGAMTAAPKPIATVDKCPVCGTANAARASTRHGWLGGSVYGGGAALLRALKHVVPDLTSVEASGGPLENAPLRRRRYACGCGTRWSTIEIRVGDLIALARAVADHWADKPAEPAKEAS